MADRLCDAWTVNDRIARQEIAPSEVFIKQSLFGDESLKLSPYTFVHIGLLDQASFKSLLVRHSVALVFDLRFNPVFEAPDFNHRSLIEYFAKRGIIYIDCLFFSSSYGDSEEAFDYYVEAMLSLKGKNFWTVCLFDNDSLQSELLPEFRNGFRGGENRFREVHPELFFGSSVWANFCQRATLP